MALAVLQLRGLGFKGICCSSGASINVIQRHNNSTIEISKSTSTAALRRGTGGRSSFSGVVATVFGNSGFLGKYVANQLGKTGTQIVLPYRGDHYDVLPLKLVGDLGQVLFFPFNLKDEESLYKAMKYSNVVINLIGKESQTKNYSFEEVHVKGARRIAAIARECGVKRLIHVSALGATEKPVPVIQKNGSGFLSSKWRGEQAVREEFPEATIFRPAVLWGEEDYFLNYYACNWRHGVFHRVLPLWKKGQGVIKTPLFVSDMALGIVNSIFEESAIGQTYEAVGPRRYELKEIIEWFDRIMLRTEYFGYKITDMRFNPFFWLKVRMIERLFPKYPMVSWDKIEFDHTSDVVTSGLPTLEDLGVKLTKMEDRLPIELRYYRLFTSYSEDYGEFPTPAPPKVYVEV